MGEIGQRAGMSGWRHRAVLAISALLLPVLAACGKDEGSADEATMAETTTTDTSEGAMMAEDVMVDDMMDESATDRIAEMAPPADPMMEMPAMEPGQ